MMSETDIEELQKKLLDGEAGYHVDCIMVSEPCMGFSKSNRIITAKSKKSFSWGRCLCKCALITFGLLFVTTLLVLTGVYFWTKDVVEHLTVTESKTFPIVEMTDAEVDLLGARVRVFFDQLVMQREPAEDLIITQDEFNGLFGHSDYLRGHMYVTMTEDHILEEYSLPMDMVPGGKGRFFLGHDYTHIDVSQHRVELKMETAATHEDWFVGPLYFLQLHFEGKDFDEYNHQHLLELFIENGSFFGNVIPDDFIKQRKNILEDVYADPDSGKDVRTVIDGIESIKVEEGKLVIKPRRSRDIVAETDDFDDYDDDDSEMVEEDHGLEFLPEDRPEVVSTSNTSMLRATKVQPARPKQAVIMTHLRTESETP